jgi:hypothetical protein
LAGVAEDDNGNVGMTESLIGSITNISQLMAISDAAYEAGICRLEREVQERNVSHMRADHLCLLTIRSER